MHKNLPDWVQRGDIKPYLYARKENRSVCPGVAHPTNWFKEIEYLLLEPSLLQNLAFGECILRLEGSAFEASAMPTPRWVFYDCAIIPGLVSGYAMKRESLPKVLFDIIQPDESLEWVPISCFFVIPTVMEGQWVAHNLSSANSFLPKAERLRGLGYLSKAFGIWYANVKKLCGVTQWTSPAIKLHSHYGNFEIVTAYTPIHTHANTFTYKSWVDCRQWPRFFSKQDSKDFDFYYQETKDFIDPTDSSSMISFQRKLEAGEGPFFLNEDQIRKQNLQENLKIYSFKL